MCSVLSWAWAVKCVYRPQHPLVGWGECSALCWGLHLQGRCSHVVCEMEERNWGPRLDIGVNRVFLSLWKKIHNSWGSVCRPWTHLCSCDCLGLLHGSGEQCDHRCWCRNGIAPGQPEEQYSRSHPWHLMSDLKASWEAGCRCLVLCSELCRAVLGLGESWEESIERGVPASH